jgi:TfoX N-terminal domain
VAYDEQTAERVRKVLSGRRDVAAKKMMGGLAFMVKGSMCCSVSGRGGMLIRVGADEGIFAEPHVRRVKMGARTMSGFARVDPEGYATDAALKAWIRRGLDAAASLPADKVRKPAARKAPKRAARKSKR